MMKTKLISLFVLMLALVLCVTACDIANPGGSETTANPGAADTTAAPDETTASPDESEPDGTTAGADVTTEPAETDDPKMAEGKAIRAALIKARSEYGNAVSLPSKALAGVSGDYMIGSVEETEAYAADISEGALSLARENAKANGVEKRIAFEKVDLLSVCPNRDLPFDAIISNPPYVTNSAYTQLEKEIYKEPKCAFLGGEDGGDFYRAITKNYSHLLSENGFFAYEIGYDQAELIRSIAKQNGFSAEIIADLSGNPRVAVLRREK